MRLLPAGLSRRPRVASLSSPWSNVSSPPRPPQHGAHIHPPQDHICQPNTPRPCAIQSGHSRGMWGGIGEKPGINVPAPRTRPTYPYSTPLPSSQVLVTHAHLVYACPSLPLRSRSWSSCLSKVWCQQAPKTHTCHARVLRASCIFVDLYVCLPACLAVYLATLRCRVVPMIPL